MNFNWYYRRSYNDKNVPEEVFQENKIGINNDKDRMMHDDILYPLKYMAKKERNENVDYGGIMGLQKVNVIYYFFQIGSATSMMASYLPTRLYYRFIPFDP